MWNKKLLQFIGFEYRMYDEVVGDRRDGFTTEHQQKVKNLIIDIMGAK